MDKILNFLLIFNSYNTNLVFFFKYSRFLCIVLDIFWDLGLIFGYKINFNIRGCYLVVYPKKEKGKCVINKIKILTRSSYKTNYVSFIGLTKLLLRDRGLSLYLISTSNGIFEANAALKLKMGGELLCKICF